MKRILAALLLVSAFGLSQPARAEGLMKWELQKDESSMSFIQDGTNLPVLAFDTSMAFDPGSLESSTISFTADLSIAFAPSKYVSDDVAAAVRFSAASGAGVSKSSPGAAAFRSQSIRRAGGSQFIMSGLMTINGQSQPMDIPFDIKIGRDLTLSGEFTLHPGGFAGEKLSDPGVDEIPVMFEFHELPAR